MEVQEGRQESPYFSTSESEGEEEKVLPVSASVLKKSTVELSKESDRLRNKLQLETSQLSQDERALLEKEITLLQQGTPNRLFILFCICRNASKVD